MRYFLSTCLLLLSLATFAQGSWQDHIKWKFSLEKIDSSHAYIVGKATLLNHFHIFSVNHDPKKADFTGTPTAFDIKANKNVKLVGKLKDGSAPKKFVDELGEQLYFEGNATFKQQIEILSNEAFSIPFTYSFQICDAAGCIFPPAQDATVKISGYKSAASSTNVPQETPQDTSTTTTTSGDNNSGDTMDQKEDKEIAPKNLTRCGGHFGRDLVADYLPC